MGIIRLSFALTRSCFKRILLFACLTVLLCFTAGLLGSFFLSGEGAIQPITIALVDEDGSLESRMLLNYLEGLGEEHSLLAFSLTDRAGSQAMLEQGAASAVIAIPEGFMAGVMDGSNPPFIVTLDAGSPMRAAIIRLFASVYADMLRTGQQGVYIALDAARDYGDAAQQQEMFRTANLRFLTAMLNRGSIQENRMLSPTGQSSAGIHYAAAAFVFLILLGSSLFIDLWARAASKPVLLRLNAMGGSGGMKAGLCYLAGAAAPFGAACLLLVFGINLTSLIFGFGPIISGGVIVALLMLILCGAAFLTAVSRLFGQGPGGCVFVFLYGLAGLFLSGGVLPPAYLAPALMSAGRLTPHYWLSRLLARGIDGSVDLGALAGSAAFVAFFALVAICAILRDGKAGAKP